VETLLRELLKTGEVFDRKIVDRFMIQYRSILPVDVSKDDVRMSRDVKNGKINITFDFWTCPLVHN
jgi:hypothetical protein